MKSGYSLPLVILCTFYSPRTKDARKANQMFVDRALQLSLCFQNLHTMTPTYMNMFLPQDCSRAAAGVTACRPSIMDFMEGIPQDYANMERCFNRKPLPC